MVFCQDLELLGGRGRKEVKGCMTGAGLDEGGRINRSDSAGWVGIYVFCEVLCVRASALRHNVMYYLSSIHR